MNSSFSFIKTQALGNDFIMIEQINGMPALTRDQMVRLADRRLGVGCDQFIFFECKEDLTEVGVRFYNADGRLAEACGNGSRALANYLFGEQSISSPLTLRVNNASILAEKIASDLICLTIRPPVIKSQDFSFLPTMQGQLGSYVLVDVGNPHLICFVGDLSKIDVLVHGPLLETNPFFEGRGINVSFAQCIDKDTIRLNVWERGSGFTGACGTGACATTAAAHQKGMVGDVVTVQQSGGGLQLFWKDDVFKLQGPAQTVYRGEVCAG